MSIRVSDFDEITDELQTVYNEVSSSAIAESVGLQLFDVQETNLKNYEHQVLHGLSGIEKLAEGQNLPRITGQEGDNITYTQVRYGALVPITKDMRKFELTNQMESIVRSITQDAFDKVDQSLADVLNHGGSTSYTDVYRETVSAVGPDGLALFSASHTNGATSATYSNVITNSASTANPAMSRDAIVETVKDGKVFTDANGLVRPIYFRCLLVPPSLEDQAMRETKTEQVAGSVNWDSNIFVMNNVNEIKVWERLETAGDSTDTSAFWYMYDPMKVKETLKCLFSERPSLDAPEEVYENKDWEYTIDYYYAIGRGYAPYIRQSQGTA